MLSIGLAAILDGTPLALLGWLMYSQQASCFDFFYDLIRPQFSLCTYCLYYPEFFSFDVLETLDTFQRAECAKEKM